MLNASLSIDSETKCSQYAEGFMIRSGISSGRAREPRTCIGLPAIH
jgi:hypothetical protein